MAIEGKCQITGCNNPSTHRLKFFRDKDDYFEVCTEHFATAHPSRIFDEDRDEYKAIKGD